MDRVADHPKPMGGGRVAALGRLLADWFAPVPGGPATVLSVPHRLLLFLFLVVIGFAVAWLVFSSLQNLLASIMAQTAQVLARVTSYPIRFWASGQDVYFEIARGKRFQAWLDTRPMFSNLPLVLTLIAVTPGLWWRRRLVYVLSGGALLFVTHFCFLYVKLQVVLITAHHIDAGSPGLWQGLDDMFEVTGKTFFPIFIWLLLTFAYMLGAVDAPKTGEASAQPRNAICACGSGKKYKRCCGAR